MPDDLKKLVLELLQDNLDGNMSAADVVAELCLHFDFDQNKANTDG